MKSLQELTGKESGIVIYNTGDGAPECVVCNWSSDEITVIAPDGWE